ncbi:MAG: chemotaxis protein CheA [Gammaproteobacteria bacterium]|nr:chemotaxis protein CheA [Gammaproteobacteria bacterium]NNJ49662.1 chemotaxis protein CheA [Gammaproteobacteria bacterium]
MDIDMSQFHDIFFEEAIEGIEIMEKELLNLKPGTDDSDIINTIFRAAHSIKGSASTFGFEEIGKFTHSIESKLDSLRNDELEITQELITLLLSSVDCLNNMLSSERSGKEHDTSSIDTITTKLDEYYSPASAAEKNREIRQDEPEPQITTADAADSAVRKWKINFFPDEKLFYTGNDPLRLIRELKTLGKLTVEASIDKLPDYSELDVHNSYLGWVIDLEGTVNQEQIEEVFAWVEGDCKLSIRNETEHRVIPDRRDNTNPAGRRKTDNEHRSIRVSTDKVDELLNLVGELVITQSILNSVCNTQGPGTSERLHQCLEQLERNTRDLQQQTMSIRMLPIDNAFQRIPRIVHDLSIAQGKNVTLKLIGESTELDKTVLEKIGDPLVHLVRNAIDHGIEMPAERASAGKPENGVITIKAEHEGGHIVLRISDDGKGIDTDTLLAKAIEKNIINDNHDLTETQIMNLIFQPGFSTAAVISDISGRGVGMDVVRQNITDLGGSVEISSEKGIGSTFTIKLPLTLAILDGQIVKVGDQTFIIPLHSIAETLMFDKEQTNTIAEKKELYQYRDKYIPVIRLYESFDIKASTSSDTDKLISSTKRQKDLLVVFETGDRHAGILVDDVIGQQQVVIKSLEKNYDNVPGVTGATILGDGSVALILDVTTLSTQQYEPAVSLNTV